MIRRIESADRADYIKFAKEFYTSDAVTHDVPEEYLTLTFETLVEGNPFSDGYMIESDGENVGYALVAKTFRRKRAVWLRGLKNCIFRKRRAEKDSARLL